jgi:DNA-binding transcriptional LysR family regulator
MSSDLTSKMQFVDRVRGIWLWLPAFRAVAETGHLPSAARELDLAPSSLSRTIRLLEENLGVELFNHSNKALVLNDAGRALLAGVRDAMRLVDEAVHCATGAEMTGVVTAATSTRVPPSVLVATCVHLNRQFPELQIATLGAHEDAIDALLLCGAVDVAVVTSPRRDPGLAVVEVASWKRSVLRAIGHPSAEPHFVVVGSRHEAIDDGWPDDVERKIAMWTHDEATALEICLASSLAIVATDQAVEAHTTRLVKLSDRPIRDKKLYLTHRRSLGTHQRTEAVISAIRATVATR